MSLAIEFEDPTQRLQGEGCIKRLEVDSELVKYLEHLRAKLQQNSTDTTIKGNDRPWHIELTRRSDRDSLVERAQELHGKSVDISDVAILNGKALVLMTPEVAGYGKTHVTIAYFPKGAPEWALRASRTD